MSVIQSLKEALALEKPAAAISLTKANSIQHLSYFDVFYECVA